MNSRKANKVEHKLKPCPFCGANAFLFAEDGDKLMRIECSSCLATMPNEWGEEVDSLVEQWNTRYGEEYE